MATSRNGTIAVGGQVVTISTDPAPCSYTLSPASVSVTSDAASGTFSMAATAGCTWTATSEAPWLTITSGASGSGNGTVGYSVAANPNTTLRSGDDHGRRADVYGDAGGGGLQHDDLADGKLAEPAARGRWRWRRMRVCAWTAASSAPWITITAGASGSGNGNVDYAVAANTSTTGGAPAR